MSISIPRDLFGFRVSVFARQESARPNPRKRDTECSVMPRDCMFKLHLRTDRCLTHIRKTQPPYPNRLTPHRFTLQSP